MTGKAAPSAREFAERVVRRLQQAGFVAGFVGGCVRDLLLGREPVDYDVVSSALPEQIEVLFKRTIPVGRKFGVMVVVDGPNQCQVATFRAEADYKDGRRPEQVRFGDEQADTLRRDFTINGLFMDPVSGKVHDWVGGQDDLQARIVRTIGPPGERFAEDHLRLLRAVRFAAQLDFEIERRTFEAIQGNAHRIQSVSAERIRDELLKLFAPPHASRGLELLRDSGLLKEVLPEIAATEACDQSPEWHPEGTVYEHLRLMLRQLPREADPLLPWAVLMHDVAKPITASRDEATGEIHFYGHEKAGAEMAEEILRRLRFPRKEIEVVKHAVRCHMQFKDARQMRRSTLRRLLLRPTFPLELALHRLDCLGSHGRLDVYEYLVETARELEKQPEIRPPLLKGDDLIAMGMQPGPDMGALLGEIREKQLQEELRTADEARVYASERIGRQNRSAGPARPGKQSTKVSKRGGDRPGRKG